jgi:large subunit ribosomal protein L15
MVLEATRFVMSLPASSSPNAVPEDAYDREPFSHPDLERLNRLVELPLPDLLSLDAVATVARQAGLIQALRWKPKMVRGCSSLCRSSRNQDR